MICNLHTVDTARSYCDRIIGMVRGHIVFDGDPSTLSMEAIRDIYGVDGDDEAFDHGITSTDMGNIEETAAHG